MEEYLLPLHLGTLALTVLMIIYGDHLAFAYMRGTKKTLPQHTVKKLHYGVAMGLAGMIITGVLMALPAWHYFSSNPAFLIKMGFVAILIGNGVYISKLMPLAITRPYADLTVAEKKKLAISGALSTIGWVGAAATAFLFL